MRPKLTTEHFIRRAKELHGNKYDYSSTVYVGSVTKVDIKCHLHGVFSQNTYSHLSGQGCLLCGLELRSKSIRENARNNRTDTSNIITPDGSRAVPLNNGKYALVDIEDYDRVMEYNWWFSNGYATAAVNGTKNRMHRFIMNITDPKTVVDHKFHNTLDNRKSQLRICTQSQNSMNSRSKTGSSSKYKGVTWHTRNNKWEARIGSNGKKHYLGTFENEEDAAKAYNKKALELFGEFALTNNVY